MDKKIEELLHAYERRSEKEWAVMDKLDFSDPTVSVDDFLLAVGPAAGRFLNMMVRDSNAKRVLELGTSYGYSTVWLAEAVRATGGELVTVELSAKKSDYARERLKEVGLDQRVEFRQGDALQILKDSEGPFDFVLLDLWKNLYVPTFDLFLSKLAPGAYVVADNMLEPEDSRPQAEAYRRRVRETKRFDSVLLPIGNGLEVSRLNP